MIRYKDGYKYQLAENYTIKTDITPPDDAETTFLTLLKDGTLTIRAGYAWDGPSGPTIDTKNFMRGSLVHDALYQLLRQGFLLSKWKDPADRLLQQICLDDGMSRIRAWWVYRGVKYGGGSAASPAHQKETLTAP